MRILFFEFVEGPDHVESLESSDLIGFGLMLCITNICILAHSMDIGDKFKTMINAPSIIFLVLFGMLYTLSCIDECKMLNMNIDFLKKLSIYLAGGASMMSYALWDYVARKGGIFS